MATLILAVERLRYLGRPSPCDLGPEERTNLDPFGTIARVLEELLDNGLFERACARDEVGVSQLAVAADILASLGTTCAHVQTLHWELQKLHVGISVILRALCDSGVVDFAENIRLGRASAEGVRRILAEHTRPTIP